MSSGVKKAFAILKQQVVSEETEPNAGGTGRKESEADFIGTAPSYWQLAAMREATDEKRKQREWKKYSRPLVVHNLEGAQDETSKLFTPRTPISSLRRLERLYLSGDANVTKQLAAHEMVRLQGWIRDQYRETKNIERNAAKIKTINIELSAEENLQVNQKSDHLTLRNLKLRHIRGEVHLQDHEFKALSNWLRDSQHVREPTDL